MIVLSEVSATLTSSAMSVFSKPARLTSPAKLPGRASARATGPIGWCRAPVTTMAVSGSKVSALRSRSALRPPVSGSTAMRTAQPASLEALSAEITPSGEYSSTQADIPWEAQSPSRTRPAGDLPRMAMVRVVDGWSADGLIMTSWSWDWTPQFHADDRSCEGGADHDPDDNVPPSSEEGRLPAANGRPPDSQADQDRTDSLALSFGFAKTCSGVSVPFSSALTVGSVTSSPLLPASRSASGDIGRASAYPCP